MAFYGQMGNATFSTPLVLLGIGITVGMWFIIGCITGLVIALFAQQLRFVLTFIFFVAVIFVTVIWPVLPQRAHYQRMTGTGYSLEECKNIPASLNGGTDRSMCIRTVATRMINEKDPAVNEQFCNDLFPEEDFTGRYCWRMLSLRKETTMDFCEQIADDITRNGCLLFLARKLHDPSICQLLRGERGDTPEDCLAAMD